MKSSYAWFGEDLPSVNPGVNWFGRWVIALVVGSLLACLLAGCASYTERHTWVDWSGSTNEYRRQIIDIGTGKRTFAVGTNGVVITHSEIPQTIDAVGRLAGTVGAAVASSGGSEAAKALKSAATKTNAPAE